MWWEILKRQVASTKGKQFQLDFNQPMIEDEDCKNKFIQLINKALNTSFGKLKLSEKDEHDITKVYHTEYKTNYKGARHFKANDSSDIVVETFYAVNPKEPFPEEVYCKALELYKTTKSVKTEEFNGYTISVGEFTQEENAYVDGKKTTEKYIRFVSKECMIKKGPPEKYIDIYDDLSLSHGFVFYMDTYQDTPKKAIDDFFRVSSI